MISSFKILLLLTLISSASLTIIRDLVQFNIAGHPIIHKEQHWPFEPEAGKKRSRLYQEVNGIRGEKAIERLGLGLDGKDQERLEQQRSRDEGHLGGLNAFLP